MLSPGMVPSPGPPSPGPRGIPRTAFDLLPHLASFLEAPPPQTLLIIGGSGTGKSTLVRSLLPRVRGPGIFIAYRTEGTSPPGEPAGAPGTGRISLLVVDPEGSSGDGPDDPSEGAERSLSFAPAALQNGSEVPTPLAEAIARLGTRAEGFVAVDSWDATSEEDFRRRGGERASVRVLSAPISSLRGLFGRAPVRGIIALSTPPDPELLSIADGVVELGWEDLHGFRLRVVTIEKLRRTPPPETRYLYSLERGEFYCPPQFAPGFRAPIAPPDPDPDPQAETLFPGSAAFAAAFGRLRPRGLTGLEVPSRFPSSVADAFLYPLVAHALSIGGRVVWIPSASSSPVQVALQLSRSIPAEFVRERLRVIAPAGPEESTHELKAVAMPLPRAASPGRKAPEGSAPSIGPLFPDAHRFLHGTPAGRPSLYVIYLDGLHALASIAGLPVSPETFPLIVGSYQRLPRFHGFGFGRADDPLDAALVASVDTHIRVEEKYGRTVLLGVRPRTSPYILDWPDESGRYTLVPMK